MKDQSTSLGLSTDPSGDRLGDSAMNLANVVPTSPTNIAPRNGVSLVAHYEQEDPGRFVFADGLPRSLENGILIICTQQADADADKEVDAVFAFYPRAIAPIYATVTGFPAVPSGGVLDYFTLTDVQAAPALP